MKKFFGYLFILAMVAFLVGLFGYSKSPAAEPQKPKELVYATYMTFGYVNCILDRWWMDEVEARSKGRVKFSKKFFDATLLKGNEVGTGIGLGQAHLGMAGLSNQPSVFPLTGAFNGVCYVASKPDVQMNALQALFKTEAAFVEELKRNKLHLLHNWGTVATILATKKPVARLEDLKGLRVRYYGGVGKALELLGATPVTISYPEIYDALSKGVIDGLSGSPFELAFLNKLHEPAPYFLDPGIGSYGALTTIMNLDTWNSLPKDIQEIMSQVSKELSFPYVSTTMESEEKALRGALRDGIKMGKLSPQEFDRWRNTAQKKYLEFEIDKLNKLGFPGDALFKRYISLANDYEKVSTYKNVFAVYEEKYKK